MIRPEPIRIHPTAVISSEANLADDVAVGPYAIIEGPVNLGPGCVVKPHAHLIGPITAGARNFFGTGCVIGDVPQHLAFRPTSVSGVVIGEGNTFREYVTVHRAMPDGRATTVIGNDNLFMVASHVGHDATIGNSCILVNSALVGGHTEVHDRALLSGNTGIHQNCKIGTLALISANSTITVDIPPFWIVRDFNTPRGVNVIGMKRAGYSSEEIAAVRKAFRMIYLNGMTISNSVAQLEATMSHIPAIQTLMTFIKHSKRGVPGPSRISTISATEGEAA